MVGWFLISLIVWKFYLLTLYYLFIYLFSHSLYWSLFASECMVHGLLASHSFNIGSVCYYIDDLIFILDTEHKSFFTFIFQLIFYYIILAYILFYVGFEITGNIFQEKNTKKYETN